MASNDRFKGNVPLVYVLFQFQSEDIDISTFNRYAETALFEKSTAIINLMESDMASQGVIANRTAELKAVIDTSRNLASSRDETMNKLREELDGTKKSLKDVQQKYLDSQRIHEPLSKLQATNDYLTGFITWLFHFYRIEPR